MGDSFIKIYSTTTVKGEEVNEEMQSGKLMFNHIMEDTIWSMTGERPNKNTNWDDMK